MILFYYTAFRTNVIDISYRFMGQTFLFINVGSHWCVTAFYPNNEWDFSISLR